MSKLVVTRPVSSPPILRWSFSTDDIDVTGPSDATKAIVVIYDIFGYFDQTIQGADILAYSDDHQKYKVYMPDWFKGEPAAIEWYPPNTKEKEEKLGAFFGKFPPPQVAAEVPGYVSAIKEKNSSLSKFGILGVSPQ